MTQHTHMGWQACLAISLASAGALVGLGSSAGDTRSQPSDQVVLGDPQRCAAYQGKPERFGIDATAGMVRIPGGSFVPGSSSGYPDERPAGEAHVASFWMDRTEVSNAQFATLVAATGYVTEAESGGGAAVFKAPASTPEIAHDGDWW